MGHVGPDADIRRPIQCCQHLQFFEARVHFLGEPASGAVAGLAVTYGHRHYEILLLVRPRVVRLQQWLKSITVASILDMCGFSFIRSTVPPMIHK